MATIQSYTDIEQSRKLAEILPLESADMYYMETSCNNYTIGVLQRLEKDMLLNKAEYYKMFPAWSLTALLDVIKEQGNVDLRFLKSTFDNRGDRLTNVWCCTFDDIGTVTLDLYADNPVDACVAMIEKLHELKML